MMSGWISMSEIDESFPPWDVLRFEIVEDGKPYCRGIVFNIGDVSPF